MKKMTAAAMAHPNIALVKYWGKRHPELNLPAVGSISLTLGELHTVSRVTFRENLATDVLRLNGKTAPPDQTARVSRFLNIIRGKAGMKYRAEVDSENNFPTGAGLASSASAFASLALAGSSAAGLHLPPDRLSELARLGSGSAARSIFGGFAEMKTGRQPDGSDAVALPLYDENYWDIRILVAVTSEAEKKIGSTEGMTRTAQTSPFYQNWVSASGADLAAMRRALAEKDFPALGELAEFNCLKMHAVAMSANPGLLYWNGTTVNLLHRIRELRREGLPVYFTIDAGPQVKAVCRGEDAAAVRAELEQAAGVLRVLATSPGGGARLLEEE